MAQEGGRWQGGRFAEKYLTLDDALAITENTVRKWHNTNRGRTNAVVIISNLGPEKALTEEQSVRQIEAMREISLKYGVLLHGHSYGGGIAFAAKHCPECLGPDVSLAHCTGFPGGKNPCPTGTTVATGPSTKSHVRPGAR